MTFIYDLIYFSTVLLFGVAVSFCFAGIFTKKYLLPFLFISAFEGGIQLLISYHADIETTRQLYPLIIHLPIIFFLIALFKCRPLHAIVSVLSAYLCCQIPLWCSYFGNIFFEGKFGYTVIYVLSAIITFIGIYCYIASPMHQFMMKSTKNICFIGAVPLIYYCFDYSTTVYTDWLYSGQIITVQFMPFVVACFYYLFVILYYKEFSLKEDATRQTEILALQLHHASASLDDMRRLQENTITYRHNMRHHLCYIQNLVSSGHIDKITDYISTVQSDIDAVTPTKYCQNEVVNLVLSSYKFKANNNHLSLAIYANVPKDISISDTNLCVILSNALENAVNGAKTVCENRQNTRGDATPTTPDNTIDVKLTIRNNALLMKISNPFSGEILWKDHLPASHLKNHGLGTKSITSIVDSYNGQYEFSSENHIFTLRILLPL